MGSATATRICRVLIVDDEPQVLYALRRELLRKPEIASGGLEIEAFDSPLEALERIREPDGQFDVALVDCRMPEMDGISLLSEVNCRWPSTARILITGDVDAEAARRAINEAAIDYLITKPWHEFDLKGCILMALRESEIRRHLPVARPDRPLRTEPYRLFLVDDEIHVVTALAREISVRGIATQGRRPLFETFTFRSGSEALAAATPTCPDLVISDQNMPGMDGITLLHRMREQCPDAVRIMLSGRSDPEMLIQAANVAGVFHVLAKPWLPSELRTTISHALIYRDLLTDLRRETATTAPP